MYFNKIEKLINNNEDLNFLNKLLQNEENFKNFILNINDYEVTLVYDLFKIIFDDFINWIESFFKIKNIVEETPNISHNLDIRISMFQIVEKVCKHLNCDRSSVFMLNKEKNELWSQIAKGENSTIKIPANKGFIGHCVKNKVLVNIKDAYKDDRFSQEVDIKTGYKTKAVLVVPIINSEGEVEGCIQAINKLDGSCFKLIDEAILKIFSYIVGSILKNSEKYSHQLILYNDLKSILTFGIDIFKIDNIFDFIEECNLYLKKHFNSKYSKIIIIDNNNKFIEFKKRKKIWHDNHYGLFGESYKKKDVIFSLNPNFDEFFNPKIDLNTSLSLVTVPFFQENSREIIGFFQIIYNKNFLKKQTISLKEIENFEYFGQILSQNIFKLFKVMKN